MAQWLLWGRFGDSVELGSAPPARLYLIPFQQAMPEGDLLAKQLGHQNKNDRNLEDFTRACDRAISCGSDGVVFPGSFLNHGLRDEVIKRCRNRKLRIVHQLTLHFFNSNPGLESTIENRLEDGDAICIVFGGELTPSSQQKEKFETWCAKWPHQIYFGYSVRSSDNVIETLRTFFSGPELRFHSRLLSRLYFHFPYHLEFGDRHLSCRKVYKLIEQIHAEFPGLNVRPLPGQEQFDPRVNPDLSLEPEVEPIFQSRSRGGFDHQQRVPIRISVIIPSYNNRDYLANTIRHLLRQDLAASDFEIVIVDDGSTDGTREKILDLIGPYDGRFNFKYLFSERTVERRMGDSNYRAGVSRNLGVKNATGEILCFLDSDILVPPHYLRDLIEKHRHFDVIQSTRLNLKQNRSDEMIRYEQIVPALDTFATEDGYWDHFHNADKWDALPFFWKYTCTYGLSLPSTLFKKVGRIRRGFIFYGFEDVELGYRLAKVGARFHLNKTATYHLFHQNDRSEFRNSDFIRQSVLAKTAQIFFLATLDPEIFRHFRGLMREQLPLESLASHALTKVGLVKPALAFWNWRWFLWRLWNQVKSRSSWLQAVEVYIAKSFRPSFHKLNQVRQRVWSERWRVRVAWVRWISAMEIWRLRVFMQTCFARRFEIARTVGYPVLKAYYFLSYQWRKWTGTNGVTRADG